MLASYVALLPMLVVELMIAWRLLHLAEAPHTRVTPDSKHWR